MLHSKHCLWTFQDISSTKYDSNPLAELDAPTQLSSPISTPYKHLGDKDEEKDKNLKENETDSGMGNSGLLDTSDPFRTSEGKLLEILSSFSNLYDEPSSHELENQTEYEDRSDEWSSSTDSEIWSPDSTLKLLLTDGLTCDNEELVLPTQVWLTVGCW